MDAERLADRIRWGLNLAGRSLGLVTDVYRSQSPDDPLARTNRFLRLHAAFTGTDQAFSHTNAYGNALWYGVFDAAYTCPGDYLVQESGTWFVASQPKLLPVLCVRTDRVVTFSRPSAQTSTGINGYGGITANNVVPLMTNWPASVLALSSGTQPQANLPGDNAVASWTVLLPSCRGIILRPADLMSDDLGRTAVVTSAELTDLGWRAAVKQVTT